ncbi:bifunctional 2-C-methyl-D-erythritol 4-phosphate cytidylyltransferase/2-C-methyl-D-erythritol 2,4-cyclodiphosphate synthase [Pelagibacterium xiamenense]|uniref:bifunctional 2-C-methyl-D-erythritol 4-phosphate cytidylyltransferase/2-C-methyl-D-erythritol 2,4-cyclodiphosphate synthase n=1 Tax=Pelagibacterium xiamenense TaxID=2901140 RepID=UPI001E54E040|nr:bifunctional 2-C-methyl-D-erythritol 4-phosphate cytidylyltransferase/2-C-methyl-D-erythritol 2,4-cyclodiphosphate synthase [Pelagibacterium xiamenense]MCD7060993.1 bifunctional 2-C-methyl-D-erythritol 4-phosphate cytidylyltransferase/2-C-methyl-D-erythritol 2,4-cyclodiphosphate synthase [Pelagibacterium xiamenense]
MSHLDRIAVIIVAGGAGARAATQGDSLPKQYRPIVGRPLLARTIEAFLAMDRVSLVLPVIGSDHKTLYEALGLAHHKLLPPVVGGSTRQMSGLAGLDALEAAAPDIVLIHDAARPFVSASLVDSVVTALADAEGAVPVTLVTDTIKRSVDGKTVGGTEDRTQLFAAQTPQGFRYRDILKAHRRAVEFSDGFTDDAAIAEWAGLRVVLSEGSTRNIKITLPGDFERAERMLSGDGLMETRVGAGYDVHAFEPGDAVVLGNIAIPHTAKLKGHSDADVVLHALADAIYGALAEGDIGAHFPPSEAQWKGADSRIFLEHAVGRVLARRGRIVHLDATIVCERPKIGPHVTSIRHRIAQIAGIDAGRVAVKATTSERLGFTGREEGIAAHAVATIELPKG